MNYSTTCKFCKLPITVEVAPDYSIEHDPNKLLPLACCNLCADVRVAKRLLEAKLSKVMRTYQLLGSEPKPDRRNKTEAALTKLTQEYARNISKWHKRQGCVWDAECVNMMLDKPERWPEILSVLWKLYRDWEKEQDAKRIPQTNPV